MNQADLTAYMTQALYLTLFPYTSLFRSDRKSDV